MVQDIDDDDDDDDSSNNNNNVLNAWLMKLLTY